MTKKRIFTLLFVLTSLTAITLPTIGFQGFHDDPGDPCLGDSDPFCGSTGDAGACFQCKPIPQDGDISFECDPSPSGGQPICTITHTSTGVSCSLSGGPCD